MKLLYPDGVTSREQHRDLIRVFGMGWVEALMLNNCVDAVEDWATFFPVTYVGEWCGEYQKAAPRVDESEGGA